MQCQICSLAFILASLIHTVVAQRRCSNLPITSVQNGENNYWVGSWNYWDNQHVTFSLNIQGSVGGDGSYKDAVCERIEITKEASPISAYYWGNMILSKTTSNRKCYGCIQMQQRTPNVIEFKQSPCSWDSVDDAYRMCNGSLGPLWTQMYRANKLAVNCKNTIEGIYQFKYESRDNRGICDSVENLIVACQSPGSPTQDDNIFYTQTFNSCPGVGASYSKAQKWDCLGSWKDPTNPVKKYFALAMRDQNQFESRIRCMLTQTNQHDEDNKLRYTISATPNCNELQNEFDGPWNIQTQPVISNEQLQLLEPGCMLPQNFSGKWFTSSQYDSDVAINTTHIQFNTKYTQFKSVDTFFSCQQTRDTRFMMRQVTQGRCEKDYVCFEFLPRHQNIIRFRMGKPYSASDIPNNAESAFRHVCSWSAFTISRTENVRYLYQTLILDPPAPIECPIAGIYNFTQTGVEELKYYTKIRGVTERPRVAYKCLNTESEFKVCAANPKTVNLDVERCATLDHVGRPIGEYDEPDNFLQCVGYWQENQRSYLVTYDTEDAVSRFRCWVYERLGWKTIRMSRGLRSACHPLQTPRSYQEKEEASLALELQENEREFDDCPQRFLDGRDPYLKSSMIYVLGSAQSVTINITLLFTGILAILFS